MFGRGNISTIAAVIITPQFLHFEYPLNYVLSYIRLWYRLASGVVYTPIALRRAGDKLAQALHAWRRCSMFPGAFFKRSTPRWPPAFRWLMLTSSCMMTVQRPVGKWFVGSVTRRLRRFFVAYIIVSYGCRTVSIQRNMLFKSHRGFKHGIGSSKAETDLPILWVLYICFIRPTCQGHIVSTDEANVKWPSNNHATVALLGSFVVYRVVVRPICWQSWSNPAILDVRETVLVWMTLPSYVRSGTAPAKPTASLLKQRVCGCVNQYFR